MQSHSGADFESRRSENQIPNLHPCDHIEKTSRELRWDEPKILSCINLLQEDSIFLANESE